MFPPAPTDQAVALHAVSNGAGGCWRDRRQPAPRPPTTTRHLPPLHNVHYTVWAQEPFNVAIYYRDVDPPNWADYSHNPYQFSPKVEADVGPNQQWNLDVGLANPDEWAMVVASTGGESTKSPNIHCALAVDGAIVATHQGP